MKKILAALLLVSLLTGLLILPAYSREKAPTGEIIYVTGEIGDTTWTTGNTYVLCTVDNAAQSAPYVTGHLTIEPGVTVLLGKSYNYSTQNDGNNWVLRIPDTAYPDQYHYYYTTDILYVDETGYITANGTAELPIVFKPYEKEGFTDAGYWSCISTGTNSDKELNFSFKYCEFINGGVFTNGLLRFSCGNGQESNVNLTVDSCLFDSSEIIQKLENGELSSIYTAYNAVYMPNISRNAGGNVLFKDSRFVGVSRAYIDTDTPANAEAVFTMRGCEFDSTLSKHAPLIIGRHKTVTVTDCSFTGFVQTAVNLQCDNPSENLIFSNNSFRLTREPAAGCGVLFTSALTAFNGHKGEFIADGSYAPSKLSGDYADRAWVIFGDTTLPEDTSLTLRDIGLSGYSTENIVSNLSSINVSDTTLNDFQVSQTDGAELVLNNVAVVDSRIRTAGAGFVEINDCSFETRGLLLMRNNLSEITITDTSFANIDDVALNISGTALEGMTVRLENITIDNVRGGLRLDSANDVTAIGLRVSNCANSGIDSIGVAADTGNPPVLLNCLVYNCGIGINSGGSSCYPFRIINCTVADCVTGVSGADSVRNCIIRNCSENDIVYTSKQNVTYSCIDKLGAFPESVIAEDPLFADPENGDYHLKSVAGRWKDGSYVKDSVSSPCIDAGDPEDACFGENVGANGGRVNMGCYGNTAQASLSEQEENPFTDVTSDKWYYNDVLLAVKMKLFAGINDTTFDPEGGMTRAMLVSVLWRVEDTPEPTTANPFTDVPSGKWYSKAVVWAAENSIVSGKGEGIFDPEEDITREQIAVILMNYASQKGISPSQREDLSKYPDMDSVSSWAKEAVSWATAEKLISGSSVNGVAYLRPQGTATRSQVAAILMRYINAHP